MWFAVNMSQGVINESTIEAVIFNNSVLSNNNSLWQPPEGRNSSLDSPFADKRIDLFRFSSYSNWRILGISSNMAKSHYFTGQINAFSQAGIDHLPISCKPPKNDDVNLPAEWINNNTPHMWFQLLGHFLPSLCHFVSALARRMSHWWTRLTDT